MYSKIMNAKLKFPSTIPAEAANLIEGVRFPHTHFAKLAPTHNAPHTTNDQQRAAAEP